MKVLVVDPGASYSTADVAAGVRDGLAAHGVEIVRYRLDARLAGSRRWLMGAWRQARKGRPAMTRPTAADVVYHAGIGALEVALRHEVDLVLAVSAMYWHPDAVIMCRRAGLRVAVLFTESPYDLAEEVRLAGLCSACWTTERSAVEAFRKVNHCAAYLRHGWHPDRHRPGPQAGDEHWPAHDVVFIGSGFPERIAWLTAIDWTGIDLGLYGAWQGIGKRHRLRACVRGGVVDYGGAAALYRRARVGLNLYRTSRGAGGDGRPPIEHAESLNPRAYELARCGAFHVSSARAEVLEVFGGAVPVVTDPFQSATVIRSWLADEAGRAAAAAQLPATVAGASWVVRAGQMVADLDRWGLARAA